MAECDGHIPFEFTTDELVYLNGMRALVPDSRGRMLFAGLDLSETAFYGTYIRRSMAGDLSIEGLAEKSRFVQLAKKHEAARLEILAAEAGREKLKPPQHLESRIARGRAAALGACLMSCAIPRGFAPEPGAYFLLLDKSARSV